ncbi:MAG: SDR family oxidoreductase [Chloroflexi bacterium]|nr:SDR family oxidoreductase [Chloroflexota bacterium]
MPHDLLKDRVALVTGAGQGLGSAVAREFAAEGAAVALVEINPASVAAVEAEIRSTGGRAQAYPLDITDYAAYQRAMDDVVARWGRLDILVNNAAIAFYATILDDTLENWRKQIAVNLEAVYMGSKMAAPIMVRQGGGRIISITSVQGFVSSGMCGAYNAAKGGIIALTKSMAVELAPHNILVNAVAPGFMLTPMSIVDGVDETTTPDFQDWYVARRKIPMARTGYPEDDAGAAVFLASEYCRYMTGQVLVVDGGLTSTF